MEVHLYSPPYKLPWRGQGQLFRIITFDKLVNSIYLYQSFHTSAFRVKYPVKTGITFLHDNAPPNNARLIRVCSSELWLAGSSPPSFLPSRLYPLRPPRVRWMRGRHYENEVGVQEALRT